jgi:hypothetical protein
MPVPENRGDLFRIGVIELFPICEFRLGPSIPAIQAQTKRKVLIGNLDGAFRPPSGSHVFLVLLSSPAEDANGHFHVGRFSPAL